MNNFPTAENIWFVEAHTCFQLFNFVCLAAISLKVSAKLTRNKFKNITASYLLTSYIISSVRMLIMSNPVLFTMVNMEFFSEVCQKISSKLWLWRKKIQWGSKTHWWRWLGIKSYFFNKNERWEQILIFWRVQGGGKLERWRQKVSYICGL